MSEMSAFNEKIIEEFRANDGRVAMFADYPMVILHTVGAKSGKEYLVPLVLTIKDNGDWILFASFAGAQKHPTWVFNLRANPDIRVEYGTEEFDARVVELSADEARDLVKTQAGVSEQFAQYVESAAPREIPVFRIERA